ncbi:MAG TPA: transposase, partial [Bacillota bacterium]|nr:transposase [Bacillota bacterium]
LPPYSPELNPIERVWRITRRQVTHNRYFASVVELRCFLQARIPQNCKSFSPVQGGEFSMPESASVNPASGCSGHRKAIDNCGAPTCR